MAAGSGVPAQAQSQQILLILLQANSLLIQSVTAIGVTDAECWRLVSLQAAAGKQMCSDQLTPGKCSSCRKAASLYQADLGLLLWLHGRLLPLLVLSLQLGKVWTSYGGRKRRHCCKSHTA